MTDKQLDEQHQNIATHVRESYELTTTIIRDGEGMMQSLDHLLGLTTQTHMVLLGIYGELSESRKRQSARESRTAAPPVPPAGAGGRPGAGTANG